MKQLRPYQSQTIALCRDSLKAGHRRVMIQLCTGAGKTVIAAEIIRMARERGNRVLFIVDAISLIDQTVERFREHGLTQIGVIQAQHEMTDYSQPIQVASVQTLARRAAPAFDLAIVDEAHCQYRTVQEMMEASPTKPFVGLSATPWSKGLGLSYDDLIVPVRMEQLIDDGYLCGFHVYAPTHPDLTSVKTTAGDFNEADLAKVMGDQALVADVVETWKVRGAGRPTLCFCVDREHARTMQDRFIAADVACGYIDAETPLAERQEIERQLNDGTIDVVTNVGCLTKGVDWSIGCIILARPTKSASLAVQMIGRGLRVNHGRAAGDCVILDHTDTVLRLGFPTDIHRETMCRAKKGERQEAQTRQAPTPRECPSCKRLTVKKCLCGYEPPRQASVLVEGDGSLAELIAGRNFDQHVRPKKAQPKDKASFYRELLGYARARDKTEKWVLATYRSKYDEWPHKKHGIDPLNPTPETLAYIRSRQIGYAKSQQRRAA